MTLVPSTERPARFGGGGSIDEIALAGHVVAYVVHRRVGVDTGASELIVADVARRFILRETAVGYSVDAGLVADEDLTALVVTPAGAVAWIAARHGIPIRPAAATVYAAAPTSGVTVLDEGPKIDPASLKLTGSTLSWTDAAGVRTGAMP
jgi:hypothetical protein